MNTKQFNIIDKVIAKWRLSILVKHIPKDSTILDFGCGHQKYLLFSLKEDIRSGVGIDYGIDNERIGNLEFIRLRFTRTLPLKTNSIDVITMLAVIEHIPLSVIPNLLSEFRRVLKNNGTIILTTPTPASKPLLEFLAMKLKIISQDEIADHVYYYAKADFIRLAKQYNFKIKFFRTFQLGFNQLVILKKQR